MQHVRGPVLALIVLVPGADLYSQQDCKRPGS